ncbi:hypothetical protein [Vibrio marisflavi]|uniref:Uncharacterized protein n=1 Tax=Vibrio marisflavi CECT 7928 TaxID=634439 RepID=A0ABM9A5G1_9VIBR|nr:hypothetical protein [Vibrio marisflavi]CAH0540367.1 hypothetical protein VMF7928_02812 [Vibrio marisflavi CECT 7928]
MSKCINPDRRTFIKQYVIDGVIVYSTPMLFNVSEAARTNINQVIKSNWKLDGETQYRTDSIEKITGQKIYGRDYRAKNIEGKAMVPWPKKTITTQHMQYCLELSPNITRKLMHFSLCPRLTPA